MRTVGLSARVYYTWARAPDPPPSNGHGGRRIRFTVRILKQISADPPCPAGPKPIAEMTAPSAEEPSLHGRPTMSKAGEGVDIEYRSTEGRSLATGHDPTRPRSEDPSLRFDREEIACPDRRVDKSIVLRAEEANHTSNGV